MAELRPYNPTWRDSIASWMMGDGRASPERRSFVTGLLGSTGLGRTGGGLLDFTPAGNAFSAQEAKRAYEAGDYGGAAIDAVGAIPIPAIYQGLKAGRGLLSPEISMASRSAGVYNPPVKPQRAFELDYPKGAPVNEAGKLTHTIDGAPITARYVVGRTEAGGSDVALPREALDEIAKAFTGEGVLAQPPSELGKAAGQYRKTRLGSDEWDALKPWERDASDGFRRSIAISTDLSDDVAQRVARHEIGHLVDDVAGKGNATRNGAIGFGVIPQGGLKKELGRVYNDINTPPLDPRLLRQERTGEIVPQKFWVTPEGQGYKAADAPGEYMAEAIRAYAEDPNYLKTVAPKTAEAVRQAVNTNPKINNLLQFNSAAPVAVVGGAAALALNQPGEANAGEGNNMGLYSPYGGLPAFGAPAMGLLRRPGMPFGDPSNPQNLPYGLLGQMSPAPAVKPAMEDGEEDKPAATAAPVSGSIPTPPPRPADLTPQQPAQPPQASQKEEPGFFGGLLDRLGNIYGNGGAGDALISLGAGLMSSPGNVGKGLIAGMELANKSRLMGAQGEMARNKLAGQNATAKLIADRMGIPYDQAQGLVASGGASTALSQIFQTKQPQLVDVQLPDGSTQKQWITPGQAGGVSVGSAKAKDDESYRPLTDPAERAKFGIRNEDKNPYQIDSSGKISAVGGGGTNVSVSTAVNPVLKGLGDQFVAGAEAARAQGDTIRSIHNARTELDRAGGIVSGAGADQLLALRKIGAAFGVQDAGAIQNTETFRTQIKPIVLDTVKGLGSGSGISNADRDFALQAVGGDIKLDEGTIRRVLDITEKAARGKIDRHNTLADKMLATQPDLAAISPMLRIDPPVAYTPPAQQAKQQGGMFQLKSKADYDALPTGTRFVAPDGSIRVKP